MRKKRIFIFLAVTAALLALLLNLLPGYASTLKVNWGISLPVSALWQETYRTDSGPSFHGDGWRYHVFSYRREAPVEQMLPWSSEEGITVFQKSYRGAADDWLDSIQVPQEQRPDYDSCAFWYASQEDNSQVILFWNPDAKKLYVAESFI